MPEVDDPCGRAFLRFINELEWYCRLREELEHQEGFADRVRAVGRVAAAYAIRLILVALALLALLYFVLRGSGD